MNIKNYIDTEELKFAVEFITPCFLGGATGNAEIRTAPFKNLIRRWWRIVNGNLSPEELWQKEAELFGSTEKNPKLGKSFGKSKVLLKILAVSENCIPTNEKFSIGDLETGYGTMSLAKYIGYGSVETKSYLPPKSKISFSLTIPSKNRKEFIDILFLIKLFGTIGSRAHNGWGSIELIPEAKTFEFNPLSVFGSFKDLNLLDSKKKYPCLIAKDKNGVLAWKTQYCRNWSEAFGEIGQLYYDLRSHLKSLSDYSELMGFASGKNRQPAQFTIKIVPQKVKSGDVIATKYYGLLIHLPYLLEYWKKEEYLEACKYAYDFLDSRNNLSGWQRNSGGAK